MPDFAEHRALQDPVAVGANRRGEVTPEQQAVLRVATRRSGYSALALLAGAVVFGVPSLCVLSPLVIRMDPTPRVPTGAQLLAVFLILVAAGALWLSRRYGSRASTMRLDAAGARVEHAAGRVAWRATRYVAETGDGRLGVSGQMDLLPGPYTFYYLPNSRYLLSAEPSPGLDPAAGRAEVLAALASAHGFSVDVLPDNRERRLAPSQRARLVRALAVMVALALVPIAATVALAMIFAPRVDPDTFATGLLCAFVFIAAMVLLGTTAFVWQARRLVRDLRAGEVDVATGRVNKYRVRERRRSGGTRYYYRVDRLRLAVDGVGYNALVAGIGYRVFFTPHSRTVVAVEPLEPQ